MVINMTNQDIFCLVEVLQSNVKFYCTFVYSCNSGIERRSLWKELETQKNIVGNQPWLVLGDFNVTMDSSEHSSSGSFRTVDMQEFKETVNSIEMEYICSNGFHFTWTKSLKNPKCTILKKLDRMLVNENFMDKYPKSFGFLETVKKEWNVSIQGCHMYKLVKNLKKLKPPLNKLSWSNGNIFHNVRHLKEKLKGCQRNIDKYPHDVTVKKVAVNTLNVYTKAVKDELAMENGNRVESIYKEKGNRFEGDQVADQFVKHFEYFLGTSLPVDPINANIFTNTLSMTEAGYMVRDVSEDEIKHALFDIDGDKSPGPDGFSSEFF
ncbi:RNA-directed DNA polymerase, eukaryota, reverse transcriptase zinc-binding domain protein [Tanacetum coccineum]